MRGAPDESGTGGVWCQEAGQSAVAVRSRSTARRRVSSVLTPSMLDVSTLRHDLFHPLGRTSSRRPRPARRSRRPCAAGRWPGGRCRRAASSTSTVGVRRTSSRRTSSRLLSASTSTCATPGTARLTSSSTRRVARHGWQNAVENCTRVARSPSAAPRSAVDQPLRGAPRGRRLAAAEPAAGALQPEPERPSRRPASRATASRPPSCQGNPHPRRNIPGRPRFPARRVGRLSRAEEPARAGTTTGRDEYRRQRGGQQRVRHRGPLGEHHASRAATTAPAPAASATARARSVGPATAAAATPVTAAAQTAPAQRGGPAGRARSTTAGAAAATAATTSSPVPSPDTSSANQAEPRQAKTAAAPVAVNDVVSSPRPSRRASWCASAASMATASTGATCSIGRVRRRPARPRRRRRRGRQHDDPAADRAGRPQRREPGDGEQDLGQQHRQQQHQRVDHATEHEAQPRAPPRRQRVTELPPANGGRTSIGRRRRPARRPGRTGRRPRRKVRDAEHPGQLGAVRRGRRVQHGAERVAVVRLLVTYRRPPARRPSSGSCQRPPRRSPLRLDFV